MRFILSVLFIGLLLLPFKANAQSWNDWHYHADVTVLPQEDDTFDAVYADFTHLLKNTFHTSGALDENSIRVVSLQEGKIGELTAYRFEKANNYNSFTNAAGTLVFLVHGTKEKLPVKYRVYFDTIANGQKPAVTESAHVPKQANMVWNSGFEIQSQDYQGSNRFKSPEGLPHGWWGNLHNRKITENLAKEVRSGQHAMGFVVQEDQNNTGIRIAPSAPGIRAIPGQNYLFSFWIRGEKLSSNHPTIATLYWLDDGGKQLDRININTGVQDVSEYDWRLVETYFAAPDKAGFAVLAISTYSQTGLLTVDDVVIREAIPPLLQ